MEYKEARKLTDEILKAVQHGNYKVSYDEPNNIYSCTAPDGRTFYKQVDLDGIKSSNDFGSITVDVMEYYLCCDLGTGDIETDLDDEFDDEYELEDGTRITREDLISEIASALDNRKDVFFGQYEDIDWQMDIYAYYNNIKKMEYYWCDDDYCPIDVDDDWIQYTAPEDLDYGTVFYQRRKYYIVDEVNAENKDEDVHAVYWKTIPDDKGLYETVILSIHHTKTGKIKVEDCKECNDQYNATESCIDI